MAAQMTYGYKTPSGVPGLIYDIAPYEANSKVSESNDGVIEFGFGVVEGTSKAYGVKLPAASTDKFVGVVVEKAHEQDASGKVTIAKGEAFSVMRFGGIWAKVDPAVTIAPGEAAYLICSGDNAGRFTNVSTDNIAVPGKFVTANEDGIAVLRLFNA